MIKNPIYIKISSKFRSFGSSITDRVIASGSEQKKEGRGKINPVFWSQSFNSKLIEAIKTGVLLTDKLGRVRFANKLALKLLGYSRGLLNGKSIRTLFLPDDTQIFFPNIMKMTREGTGFEGEALLRKKDGSSFFVNLSTAIYKGDSPGQELMIFTLQDITRLKKMEKESTGSERFTGLGAMTDQISHQIRNPIVSIGGFALRLAKHQIPNEDYTHYTRIIHDEAKRLEYIIDRLVEFAQVYPARYSALTISEILDGVRDLYSAKPEKDRMKIKFSDTGILPAKPVFGDLPLIVRAVQCVVQNGLEAISNGGKVRVTGEIIDNQAIILVKDNGEGISAEDLPFIFDPFFTTKFNYLGLGLTMAKRIIQEHKGQVEVKAAAKKGTEVRITLPLERRREIRTKLIEKIERGRSPSRTAR